MKKKNIEKNIEKKRTYTFAQVFKSVQNYFETEFSSGAERRTAFRRDISDIVGNTILRNRLNPIKFSWIYLILEITVYFNFTKTSKKKLF